MSIAADAQEKVAATLNAEGRDWGHLAMGAALCLAVVGVTTALSVARPQAPAPGAEPSRKPLVRALWPSLTSVTTFAALRLWNAPASSKRTGALGLWGLLQAANAALMLWPPRRRETQIASALATAALTAACARQAASVDGRAAGMLAPSGFAGLAALIADPQA